jgi:hypothetical protein
MNGHANNGEYVDGNDHDADRGGSGRKQRKSTPRKIPRRASGTRKGKGDHSGEDDGEGEEEEEGEEEGGEEEEGSSNHSRNDDHNPSFRFQALTDTAPSPHSRHLQPEDSSPDSENCLKREGEPIDINAFPSKRILKDFERHRELIHNGDFAARIDTMESELKGEEYRGNGGEDTDLMPAEQHRLVGKGAKLDSLIAQKFNTS